MYTGCWRETAEHKPGFRPQVVLPAARKPAVFMACCHPKCPTPPPVRGPSVGMRSARASIESERARLVRAATSARMARGATAPGAWEQGSSSRRPAPAAPGRAHDPACSACSRPSTDARAAQRAAIVTLLYDRHEPRWSFAELRAALGGIDPWTLAAAIERLHQEGAIEFARGHILASRAVRRLHELGLLALAQSA